VIVADTSGLVALFNRAEPTHAAVAAAVRAARAPHVVSPFVVAEVDHLVATRIGAQAAVAVLREFAGGAYVLPALDEGDLRVAADVMERYGDQAVGVADASIVVLADRYATRRVLTLDRRHFEVVRAADGAPFELLP
jgi:predicted nucleic acid-binding protein